jgi:lysophospholipase L1-like esterase
MTISLSRCKFFVLLTLLLAGLLFWLWPDARWRYRNLPPSAPGPWVAFGDSLTEGYGANSGEDFPTQLGQRLGRPIRNLGVAGETSADGLRRLEQVEGLLPEVVLLCFGGNDVLQGVSRDRMFTNLGAMIERLQARGSFVVLIGVPGSDLLGDSNAKAFLALARQKEVMHLPNLLDGILSQPSLMSDYVHPNAAGYAKIADRLEKVLRPLLARLDARPGAPAAR